MTSDAKRPQPSNDGARSAGWVVAGAWCLTALVVAVGLPLIARVELRRLSDIASSYFAEGEIQQDDQFQKILAAQGEVHRQLSRFELELQDTLSREKEARERALELQSALDEKEADLDLVRGQLRRVQAKIAQANLAANDQARQAPSEPSATEDGAAREASPDADATESGDPPAETVAREPAESGEAGLSADLIQKTALEGLIGRLPPDLQEAAMRELMAAEKSSEPDAPSRERSVGRQAKKNLNRLLEESGALFRLLDIEAVEDGILQGVSASLLDRRGYPVGSVVAKQCHVSIDGEEKMVDFRFEEGSVVEDGVREKIDPFYWIRVVDVLSEDWTALGPDYARSSATEEPSAEEPSKEEAVALPLIVSGPVGPPLSKINQWLLGSGERSHYQFESAEAAGSDGLKNVVLVRRSSEESVIRRLEAARCEVSLLAGQGFVQLDLYDGRIAPENGSPQEIASTGFRLILPDIDEARWRDLAAEWVSVVEPPPDDEG